MNFSKKIITLALLTMSSANAQDRKPVHAQPTQEEIEKILQQTLEEREMLQNMYMRGMHMSEKLGDKVGGRFKNIFDIVSEGVLVNLVRCMAQNNKYDVALLFTFTHDIPGKVLLGIMTLLSVREMLCLTTDIIKIKELSQQLQSIKANLDSINDLLQKAKINQK